jgi:ABC-type transport system substrate-binding protein
VERIAVVADRGYFKIEDIEACEKAGIDPYVPRPQRGPSVRAGLFRKDGFRYDPTSDSFLCPAGQHLHPYSSSLMRGLKKINYRNSQACRDCAIRSQCTGHQFRSVSHLENEAVLDRTGYCNAEVDKLIDKQSAEPDPQKRKKIVWEIERKLIEDDARPILFYTRAANCHEPYLKGLTTMVNSIYNGSRFEDLWLDK